MIMGNYSFMPKRGSNYVQDSIFLATSRRKDRWVHLLAWCVGNWAWKGWSAGWHWVWFGWIFTTTIIIYFPCDNSVVMEVEGLAFWRV